MNVGACIENVGYQYKSNRLNLCTKYFVSLGSRSISSLPMLTVAGLNRNPSIKTGQWFCSRIYLGT